MSVESCAICRQSHRRATPRDISKAIDEASVLDQHLRSVIATAAAHVAPPILEVKGQTDEAKNLPLGLDTLGFLFADRSFGRAATLRLRYKGFDFGAEDQGSARDLDRRQSSSSNQIRNGLFGYAPKTRRLGL